MTPEALLLAQRAIHDTEAAQRLRPLMPSLQQEEQVSTLTTSTISKSKGKKKKSRTRFIEIADAEDCPTNSFDDGGDYPLPIPSTSSHPTPIEGARSGGEEGIETVSPSDSLPPLSSTPMSDRRQSIRQILKNSSPISSQSLR